ncbi:MAG: cytochrome c biogenesis CcdA family protein [Nitrososphaerales archaeon]|nr:sulfite exporter TauE/SafE family protein [Nitrososphaerota archaeon]
MAADPLTLAIAGGAGVLSFFSPCIVPMIPAYLAHISGVSLAELDGKEARGAQLRVFKHSLLFVIGFAGIFVLLGSSISFLSQQIPGFQLILSRVGGVIIIVFGMYTMRILPSIPFLEREYKIQSLKQNTGYFGSAFIGASFGIGWTPCVGPILASILVLAGSSGTIASGASLLTVFSVGLAVPFLMVGLFTAKSANLIKRINRRLGIVSILSGALLIGLGIVVFTDNFSRLLSLFL